MLFSSHQFIFLFLPFAIVLVWLARRYLAEEAGLFAVVGASLLFYYLNGLAQLPVLVASVLINQTAIAIWLRLHERKPRAFIIALAVIFNLSLLFYYKYIVFVTQQWEIAQMILSGSYAHGELKAYISQYYAYYPWGYSGEIITLPLGISFFTFQQIAYLADLQAGRVSSHRFTHYLFCVTFFPHLIAGPIVNYRELIPQIKRVKAFALRGLDITVGLSLFSLGLFKKGIIADTLADLVSPGFDAGSGTAIGFATAWTAALAYAFQIYFDFSGYSDMAIGLARIFGFDLPVNFFSPYKATSIIDFWRRWHITLSRFLRQYLYIPLGGNRHGAIARYRNLIVTMALGGLWHGAGWTFVLWGLAHGVLLTLNHAWRAAVRKSPSLAALMPGWLAWALTFLAVVFAWVLFRAPTLDAVQTMLQAMLTADPTAASATAWSRKHALLPLAAAIAFLMPSSQQIFYRYRVAISPDWVARRPTSPIAWRASLPWLLATAFIAAVACFYQTDFPKFLYWSF
jgi:D-alanyl-lipoteichoic acid acyltransferase DltB (MBOAT superfamily)